MGGGYIDSKLQHIYARIENIEKNNNDVYGLMIDLNESEPSKILSYVGTNQFYKPAHMDFANDVFDYGDWKDAWFIKGIKVVLMNGNGDIICELDKNDYTKDIDGNDVSSDIMIDNVMIGIPIIYTMVEKYDDYQIIWFSRFQTNYIGNSDPFRIESDNGNEADYLYIGAYDSSYEPTMNVMRSISGQNFDLQNQEELSLEQYRYAVQVNYSRTAGTDNSKWDMLCFTQHQLINLLLLLIGRNTDCQAVFGNGRLTPGLSTGTMNKKGLFWGTNSDNTKGVKVFGIENWWGNFGHVCLGIWNTYIGYNYDDRSISKDYAYQTYLTITEYRSDMLPFPSSTATDENLVDYVETLSNYCNDTLYMEDAPEPHFNHGMSNYLSQRLKFIDSYYGLLPFEAVRESNEYFPDPIISVGPGDWDDNEFFFQYTNIWNIGWY